MTDPSAKEQTADELYRAHSQELYAFLLGVLRDRDAAADALQSTFRQVLEHGTSVRGESWRGWLFQVAYREALQLRRKQAAAERTRRRWWERRKQSTVEEFENDPLVSEEVAARLRAGVGTLPPEQQEVVRRRVHDGQTFAEIASDLNLPIGTVLPRMRLALEKLRKQLADER